ncbi:MAG: lytic murein transglycosylase B, partial [Legionella sp.]
GSYAGAIGKPQFMPSSYRYYAVDFGNKGKRDLVNNNEDAIGSIANYFHKHGWKSREGIAQLANVQGRQYKRIRTNPRRANYHYYQLESAGIRPVTAAYHHPGRAALIQLTTKAGSEYWLAYPNFFVITRYNSNPQYALVVYLLSQQLKQQWAELNTQKLRAYV